MNERENDILREMLLTEDFEKMRRIQEIANTSPKADEDLRRLRDTLKKAKSELALLEENYQHSHPMQQIQVIKMVNDLTLEIREVERKKLERMLPEMPSETNEEFMSESTLRKHIEYEVITKKINKMQEEMKKFYDRTSLSILSVSANHDGGIC